MLKKKAIKWAGKRAVYLMTALLLLSMVAVPAMAVIAARNSVNAAAIQNQAVISNKIQNGAVTRDRIARNSISTRKIIDHTIKSRDLKNGSVTKDRIADNAVTNAKMADNSVDTTEIVALAVTNAKLGADVLVMRLGAGFTAGDTMVNATMSFDATYAAGGEIVSPGTSLTAVMIVPSKGGYVFEIDETSFSAGSFRIKAMETSDTTSAPLTEVTAGTDLSAITNVRYLAIGQ